MTWASIDYHRDRAEQEVERARSATSMCARRAHLELAKLHEQHVRSERDRPPIATG